jgi:hypothetical protein
MFQTPNILDYNDLFSYPNKQLSDETLDKAEELFGTYIETTFGYNTSYIDGFDELFQLQNFFPYFVGKNIDEGKWIRVKSEAGYNIYWAKHSNKILSIDKIQRDLKKLNSKSDTLEVINKKLKLTNDLTLAQYVNEMPSPLKYVKALRTKTQWLYLLPHEYEIVTDIQLYVNAVLDKDVKKSVKYKQLFTKQDNDQIHYMQSRGIPRDVAVMMSRLEQCYFTVDVQELFNEWMQPV